MTKELTKEDQFDVFICTRNDRGDWDAFMSKDKTSLVRQKILNSCGFPRSTLYQNSKIKVRLAEAEARLRAAGVLVSKADLIENKLIEESKVLEAAAELEVRIDKMQIRISMLLGFICETQSRVKMDIGEQ